MSTKVEQLRRTVQENIRVQRGGSDPIEYIDVARALSDMVAKQNHVVFGRRGCGKTLLLHATNLKADSNVRVVYINCEDYKQHSFPNVLIEILDAVFDELQKNLSGWFGRKRRSRDLITEIRSDLSRLKEREDEAEKTIKETHSAEDELWVAMNEHEVEVRGAHLSKTAKGGAPDCLPLQAKASWASPTLTPVISFPAATE